MNEFDKTEWSSNLDTLQRIGSLIKDCAEYSFKEDCANWYRTLRVLRLELLPKLKEKDNPVEELKMWDDLTDLYWQSNQFANLSIKIKGIRLLYAHELWIRTKMNNKGMLLRDGEDNRGL